MDFVDVMPWIFFFGFVVVIVASGEFGAFGGNSFAYLAKILSFLSFAVHRGDDGLVRATDTN